MFNHFANSRVGLPDEEIAKTVNDAKILLDRMEACLNRSGQHPNLMVVDFWSRGDLPEVTQVYNTKVAAGLAIIRDGVDITHSSLVSKKPAGKPSTMPLGVSVAHAKTSTSEPSMRLMEGLP